MVGVRDGIFALVGCQVAHHYLVAKVLGQLVSPVSKGQAVREEF